MSWPPRRRADARRVALARRAVRQMGALGLSGLVPSTPLLLREMRELGEELGWRFCEISAVALLRAERAPCGMPASVRASYECAVIGEFRVGFGGSVFGSL